MPPYLTCLFRQNFDLAQKTCATKPRIASPQLSSGTGITYHLIVDRGGHKASAITIRLAGAIEAAIR